MVILVFIFVIFPSSLIAKLPEQPHNGQLLPTLLQFEKAIAHTAELTSSEKKEFGVLLNKVLTRVKKKDTLLRSTNASNSQKNVLKNTWITVHDFDEEREVAKDKRHGIVDREHQKDDKIKREMVMVNDFDDEHQEKREKEKMSNVRLEKGKRAEAEKKKGMKNVTLSFSESIARVDSGDGKQDATIVDDMMDIDNDRRIAINVETFRTKPWKGSHQSGNSSPDIRIVNGDEGILLPIVSTSTTNIVPIEKGSDSYVSTILSERNLIAIKKKIHHKEIHVFRRYKLHQ